MTKTIITVEHLSKSYLIGHHSVQRERYTAFRDVIAREARNFARKAADVFHGRQIVEGDEVEEFFALKNINFQVKEGEIFGIIGRNGAGKSTLLKILSRITEPTTGRIEIRGRLASLLEVGTGFHPELTGRENIYLNGAILGMSRKEIARKLDEIVAFAEVEQFLDTPVKHYSSGMYVRLAFAVAGHLESEILVVDEVLAVGDAAFQKKCLAKMGDAAGHGRTVLFVSHNMAVVRTLCTRGMVLEAGRIVADTNIVNAIDSYLKSDFSTNASITWAEDKAPRCAEAVLRKAYIADIAGAPISVLNFRDGFSIVLEYELLSPLKQMRVGILIQNSQGVLICGSTDWGAWQPTYRGPGVFQSVCSFPGHVLNKGRYSVAFGVDAAPHLEQKIRTTDYCLAFDIEDIDGHGPNSSPLIGVVRPVVGWNVTQVLATRH
jgi:homopolymeric O-antigen transport system ATP-binding protein